MITDMDSLFRFFSSWKCEDHVKVYIYIYIYCILLWDFFGWWPASSVSCRSLWLTTLWVSPYLRSLLISHSWAICKNIVFEQLNRQSCSFTCFICNLDSIMFVSWVIWDFQEPSFVHRYEDEENLVILVILQGSTKTDLSWSSSFLQQCCNLVVLIMSSTKEKSSPKYTREKE